MATTITTAAINKMCALLSVTATVVEVSDEQLMVFCQNAIGGLVGNGSLVVFGAAAAKSSKK